MSALQRARQNPITQKCDFHIGGENANILTKIYKTRINRDLVKARNLLENSGLKLSQGPLFT